MSRDSQQSMSRRGFLTGMSAASLAVGAFGVHPQIAHGHEARGTALREDSVTALNLDNSHTAVVVIDPQNDVLSENGLAWGAVGASVQENHTVENIERILKAAKSSNYDIFISPHYFYPTDDGWTMWDPLEAIERQERMFARGGPLTLEGFAGSGADWLARFKPYIDDGKTIICSPHRVWGPETNDLVLQLRKRRVTTVMLCGMLANICVESHLRELLEQGFEVMVVKDATAGPRHPEWGDGYQAALINYAFLAHAVARTDEAVQAMTANR